LQQQNILNYTGDLLAKLACFRSKIAYRLQQNQGFLDTNSIECMVQKSRTVVVFQRHQFRIKLKELATNKPGSTPW
jgi:hypothetical protein